MSYALRRRPPQALWILLHGGPFGAQGVHDMVAGGKQSPAPILAPKTRKSVRPPAAALCNFALSPSHPHRHHRHLRLPPLLLSCLARGLDSPVQTVDCRRRGLRELDPSRYALGEHEATHLSRQQTLPALCLLALACLPFTSPFSGAIVRREYE